MLSNRKKKIILIGSYTLILTIVICFCFISFVSYSKADINNMPQVFYFDTPNKEVINFSAITSQQLHDYFKQSFFQYFPLLACAICFFILLFSGILFFLIKYYDKKHNEEIANDLKNVAFSSLEDIKEPLLRKEYEQINQKLLAFEEDQQRLHSYISHEQKNLITLMKGRIDPTENACLLEDINQLSQSVDDILALSANQNSPKSICNFALIAAEECDHYRRIYPQLNFDFEEEKEYTVLGKEQWLRRAIDNLLDNAIKYGNQKEIEVYLKQTYDSVLFYVKDYGKGMSEKEQQRIFDYGYQIHELKKDGYGIGLSLVCHVCTLCDAFVNVKSDLGHGSLFILSFPLTTELS